MGISAYAGVMSVFAGADVTLHVGAQTPRFRVEFYRLGRTLEGPLAGSNAQPVQSAAIDPPARGPSDDWGWPAYAFAIPEAWRPGIYIAMLVEADANGADIPNQPLDRTTPDGLDRKAMFVVRAPPGGARPILFKVPTNTYQAYNYTGGGSSYGVYPLVSLARPGCGTGGPTTFAQNGGGVYQLDVYDPTSDRMNVGHLEAPFVRWLETNGYADRIDYCSDFDLHFSPDVLDTCQLLLSVGHDEYWSEPMRTAVETFLQRGGHVAFFSGNTCWKHVTFTDANHFNNDGNWMAVGKPTEDSFTGVSYRHANGRWDGPRQTVGYTLQFSDHWILNGVGGAVLGDVYANDPKTQAALIGYECDGAPAEMRGGFMAPKGPPTPPDFMILGYAQLDGSWQDNLDGTNLCTMGLYTNAGISFTVATVDWARVLDDGREPRVGAITNTVISTLSQRTPPGWATLGGQLTSTPLALGNQDGRLEAFGRGYDGSLRHTWQTAPNGGWAGWGGEGGALDGSGYAETSLAGILGPDGRLSVFARFADHSIRRVTQTAPNTGWGAWQNLGGNVAGDPAVGVNGDGRLEVFAVGFDGRLYHCWQTAVGSAFTAWADLGGASVGNVVVVNNADRRLEVFARGADGAIWHIWQSAPNGGWTPWASFGGAWVGEPAVGTNADGRLEAYARATDNTIWHLWQGTPNGGWTAWASLGGAAQSSPVVGRSGNGCLEVFVRGPDAGVWRAAQTAPNGGWGGWTPLGGAQGGDVRVGVNADGRLELFSVALNRSLWHRWQSAPGVW